MCIARVQKNDPVAAQSETRPESTLDRCVACGVALPDRHVLGREAGGYVACPACRAWTVVPRPDQAALVGIHDDPAYFASPYCALRRENTEGIRRRCRDIFARVGCALDVDALRGERVLDIGCEAGSLLVEATQQYGVVPVGIDIASRPIALARERGIDATQCDIEHAPQAYRDFGLITAVDVIEHVPDPAGFLIEVGRRLRPGGVLYLETPNIHSQIYRIGRLLSHAPGGLARAIVERLFPPEHVQYFTRASLQRLAAAAGLEVVALDSRPIPFAEIATSALVRAGLRVLQALDTAAGTEIILCAVLRHAQTATEPSA